VEDTQTDPSVLVVGLNPGEERILAGKIAMFASAVAPLLSPIQGTGAWFFFCIAFLLSIVLTCGQQYVLDSSWNMLKKRRLYFLRSTEWTVLGKLSDIHIVKRRKSSSDDGGEAMNSWIDFMFKDGTTHTWSLSYGPSDVYRDQINGFLTGIGGATVLPSYEVPGSTPATSERAAMPSSPPNTTVWDTIPQPTKSDSPSAPTSVWDVAPAAPENTKSDSQSVWDN
jgi:hypothetical protein